MKASMQMKRVIIVTVGAALLMAALFFVFLSVSSPPGGRVDAEKLVAATHAYTQELKARGLAVPESVSLEELIRRGLLRREDVKGFDGMQVTVGLDASETRPQHTLIRVRMPDGQELAALGDGSVQAVRK